MPFVSKKQYRWAFASGQPWARRWARETPSLTKLPAQAAKASEDLATAPAAAPAGAPTKPSGKMTPSERARYAALIRWEKLKAQGKQPGGKGKAKAKAPAGPSAEEVAAATANEIEQAGRGLDKDSLGALQAFAEGGPLDESKAERLSNLGLIEKDRDGNYRATSDGTSVANAARSGNTRQALDSLSRASDKMGKRAEAEASRQAKEKAAEEAKKKEAEKKKGGGGGGGKKDEEKKKEEEKAAAEAAAKEKEEARKKAIERLKGQIDKAKMGYKLNPYEQVEAVTLGLGTFDNAGNFTPTKDVETKAEDGFTPPQAVQAAARRALEQRAEQSPSNRGGTPVGLARARDLANGRSLSMGTVRRMKAFFDRHRGTKPTVAPVEDSKWEQAWGLWGGNAGYRWAQSVVNRAEAKANEPTNPELWAESIREAKKRFRVYPSAYANAWAARRYKQKGGSWRSSATKDLREWFAEEWVDISRPKDGGGYEVCGRPTEGMNQAEYRERYPKCLPKKRAMKLTEAQRLRLIRRKRRTGLPEEGKPTMTSSSTKGYLWKSEENDVAVKHGKHNQASHGRRTGRRRAYNAAYSQARAGGATPQEARALAKEAGLARQAERDARLGRLREASERRKNAPAAPAPAAPQGNPALQKQLDDVKQRRSSTEAEIEQSRSKLKQLEQDKKFDEYNREDSRLRTLTERRNSLVREERDVSGMLQDDIRMSRQATSAPAAPAVPAAKPYAELTTKEKREISRNDPAAYLRGEASLLRADAARQQAEGSPGKLLLAKNALNEARMFEAEANKLDQDRLTGSGMFKPRPAPTTPAPVATTSTKPTTPATQPKPTVKPKTSKTELAPRPVIGKQEFERRSSELLQRREQANADRYRAEMNEQKVNGRISGILSRKGTRSEQPNDAADFEKAKAELPSVQAAARQSRLNFDRAFDEWLNFQNEFNPQPPARKRKGATKDALLIELDLLELE